MISTRALIAALLALNAISPRAHPVVAPPLTSMVISSNYGPRKDPLYGREQFHYGIDFRGGVGEPIRAVAYGRVVFAGRFAGYGLLLVLEHGRGFTSHYGHCEKLLVQVGDRVSKGQVVAEVGSTGRATGPHLHFELRENGGPLDPAILLRLLKEAYG